MENVTDTSSNNNMIYVIGDSFAWGDELADHILPYFWGWREQLPLIPEQWSSIPRHYPTDSKDPLYIKHETYRIENRWSNLLGKQLSMEVVNKSLPGKSVHGMLTTLSHDIDTLKNANLVILQLTGLHRFQVPYLSGSNSYIHEGYAQLNPLLGLSFEKPEYYEIGKLRMVGTEEIDFLYDYLNCILLIQQLVKYITNTELLIVDSVFLSDYGNIKNLIEEHKEQENIKKILALTDFENKTNMFPSMSDIHTQNKDVCCIGIGSHYCHQTHKLFAEALYDTIIRENIFPKKH